MENQVFHMLIFLLSFFLGLLSRAHRCTKFVMLSPSIFLLDSRITSFTLSQKNSAFSLLRFPDVFFLRLLGFISQPSTRSTLPAEKKSPEKSFGTGAEKTPGSRPTALTGPDEIVQAWRKCHSFCFLSK